MNPVLIVALAGLAAGLAKGGLGPLGLIMAPLLGTMMPISQAVGLSLPMLMVGDVVALKAYWRQWDTFHIRLLIPAAVAGVALGVLLLTALPDDVLRRVLGIFTLLVAAYKLANDALPSITYVHRPWHSYLAGSTSGFASALANAGGPPMTAYLLLQKLSPVVFVATNVLFFAVMNAIKLPFFIASGVTDIGQFLSVIWVIPVILLGVWIGRWIIRRISARLFDWLMLIFLVYTGLSLLLG